MSVMSQLLDNGRWHSSSAKELGSNERVSAPVKPNMKPEGYAEVWNSLIPASEHIVSEEELKECKALPLQQPFFFGGSSTMRTCKFEPDGLGSIRLFTSGKVRIQCWKASELQPHVKMGQQKDFASSCEKFMVGVLVSGDLGTLPTGLRAIVDCSGGPKALVVPPGWLLVQEALDATCSAGVRRSFSPKAGASEFALAAAESFAFKDKLLAAMKR